MKADAADGDAKWAPKLRALKADGDLVASGRDWTRHRAGRGQPSRAGREPGRLQDKLDAWMKKEGPAGPGPAGGRASPPAVGERVRGVRCVDMARVIAA
ncbi:hypothetical protein [Streptomyces sp. NPDC127190]|uniref:hypothetical protein n=1 Tax=unclassified Streptomyces TaxID=2593676 RepID=UPI00363D5153